MTTNNTTTTTTNQQPAPRDVAAGASAAGAPLVVGTPAAGAAVSDAAGDTAEDLGELREQMLADRFDAAAARAGIDEAYTDVALELFRKTGQQPTKQNLTKFCTELKKTRPALFGPQPAQTAPTPNQAAPTSPAPGAVATPYQQWRALRAAGRQAEAEAYYAKNRSAISRTAG